MIHVDNDDHVDGGDSDVDDDNNELAHPHSKISAYFGCEPMLLKPTIVYSFRDIITKIIIIKQPLVSTIGRLAYNVIWNISAPKHTTKLQEQSDASQESHSFEEKKPTKRKNLRVICATR